eukprot:CAMPEP_0176152100 /NCGR_PEP_ID=MMETSP0120_2-20121206/77682_1 /TAXON_ID=160619 /ORGANISM="Kryptoperidinium foliaceum, Strain CCMP 1326" /LENGTH=709 /DNA_ID=CAMNT_0017489097 /DNA_START=6 /DNA_END=2136 /DNA_ORIENTATION=-
MVGPALEAIGGGQDAGPHQGGVAPQMQQQQHQRRRPSDSQRDLARGRNFTDPELLHLRPLSRSLIGADLAVGSVSSLPEGPVTLPEDSDGSEVSDARLSSVPDLEDVEPGEQRWDAVMAKVVEATSNAASKAVEDQLVVMMPRLMDNLAAVVERRIEAVIGRAKRRRPNSDEVESEADELQSESGASAMGPRGTTGASIGVRSLEAQLADAVLEQHGLGITGPSRVKQRPATFSAVLPSAFSRHISTSSRHEEPAPQIPGYITEESKGGSNTGEVAGRSGFHLDGCENMNSDSVSTANGLSEMETINSGLTPRSYRGNKTRMDLVHDRAQQLTDTLMSIGTLGEHTVSPGASIPLEQRLPNIFRLCGVAPWDGGRRPYLMKTYQFSLLAIGVGMVAGLLHGAFSAGQALTASSCGAQRLGVCWHKRGLYSSLPVAIAIVFTLLLLLVLPGSLTAHQSLTVLQAYLQRYDLVSKWNEKSKSETRLTFCLWFLTVAVVCASVVLDTEIPNFEADDMVFVVAMTLLATLCAGWTHCMFCLCRALADMVDQFCCSMAEAPDVVQAMMEWNIVQAVLLKVSLSIEWSFLSMLFAIGFTMPLLLVDLFSLGNSLFIVAPVLPSFLLMAMLVRVGVFVAAGISDKCARVPALVNSLCFGTGTESRRQMLVEYILRSDAGFYVRDFRLTTGMSLKFLYTWCVVAIGFATNLLTSSGP